MPNRDEYNRSNVDWSRIEAQAVRAARETKKPREQTQREVVETRPKIEERFFGLWTRERTESVRRSVSVTKDYWSLCQLYFEETSRNPFFRETEWRIYCLGVDGSLFVESFTEVLSLPHGTHRYAPDRRPMSEWDLAEFDFELRHYHGQRPDGTEISRNDQPGRLISRRKGDGLLIALGELLGEVPSSGRRDLPGKHTASIKWFDPNRGYGFLDTAETLGKDVFLHISNFVRSTPPSLASGDMIEFTVRESKKGLAAHNARKVRAGGE